MLANAALSGRWPISSQETRSTSHRSALMRSWASPTRWLGSLKELAECQFVVPYLTELNSVPRCQGVAQRLDLKGITPAEPRIERSVDGHQSVGGSELESVCIGERECAGEEAEKASNRRSRRRGISPAPRSALTFSSDVQLGWCSHRQCHPTEERSRPPSDHAPNVHELASWDAQRRIERPMTDIISGNTKARPIGPL